MNFFYIPMTDYAFLPYADYVPGNATSGRFFIATNRVVKRAINEKQHLGSEPFHLLELRYA
jgi:hypothetical protein